MKDDIPPAPDKWTDTEAYVRWLLAWYWPGAPTKNNRNRIKIWKRKRK